MDTTWWKAKVRCVCRHEWLAMFAGSVGSLGEVKDVRCPECGMRCAEVVAGGVAVDPPQGAAKQ